MSEIILPLPVRHKELYIKADRDLARAAAMSVGATAALHAGIEFTDVIDNHGVRLEMPFGYHYDTVYSDGPRNIDKRSEDGELIASMQEVATDNKVLFRKEYPITYHQDDQTTGGWVEKPSMDSILNDMRQDYFAEDTIINIRGNAISSPIILLDTFFTSKMVADDENRVQTDNAVIELVDQLQNAFSVFEGDEIPSKGVSTLDVNIRAIADRPLTFENYQKLTNLAAKNGYGDVEVYSRVFAEKPELFSEEEKAELKKVQTENNQHASVVVEVLDSNTTGTTEACVIEQDVLKIDISEQTPIGLTVPFFLPILFGATYGVRRKRLRQRQANQDNAPIPARSTLKSVEASTASIDELIEKKRYELAKKAAVKTPVQSGTAKPERFLGIFKHPEYASGRRGEIQAFVRTLRNITLLAMPLYFAAIGYAALDNDIHSPKMPAIETADTDICPADAIVHKGKANSTTPTIDSETDSLDSFSVDLRKNK